MLSLGIIGGSNVFFIAHACSGVPQDTLWIYFPANISDYQASYLGNSAALAELERLVAQAGKESVESVEVLAYASPEGSERRNMDLCAFRVRALTSLVNERMPEITSLIHVTAAGEAWDILRSRVASDATLAPATRSDLLAIIDNTSLSPDSREAAIKSADLQDPNVGDVYQHLLQNHFPLLRGLMITVIRKPEVVVSEPVAEPQPVQEPEQAVEPEQAEEPVVTAPVQEEEEPVVADEPQEEEEEPAEVEPIVVEPEQYVEPADSIIRTPLFALSTNLLFEYATVFTGYNTVPLNIGIEVPIGQHWSAYADYIISTPWHAWNNNAECFELMHLNLGGRWYPGGIFRTPFRSNVRPDRLLDGFYAYGSAGVGYYDFELAGKGYQGEEILGAVGAGYNIVFGDVFSVNFCLGVGPLFTRYRYYEGRSNNEHLMFQYRGNWRYLALTDAKISLVWLLYYNRKTKSKK